MRARSNRTRAVLSAAIGLKLAWSGHAIGQIQASWVSATSGTFTDPSRWSTSPGPYPSNGTPAGTTYDAIIAQFGERYTVALSSGVTLDSLTIAGTSTLQQTGGTLQVQSLNIMNSYGRYSITGNATLDAPSVRFEGNSWLTIGKGRVLTFAGDSTFSGWGMISFDTGPGATGAVVQGTLTVASGARLASGQVGSGTAAFTGPGTIVNHGLIEGNGKLTLSTASVVNYGKLTYSEWYVSNLTNGAGGVAEADGLPFTVANLVANEGMLRSISPYHTFTIMNALTPTRLGTIESTDGGRFHLAGGFDLEGANDYSFAAPVTLQRHVRNGRLVGENVSLGGGDMNLDNVTLTGTFNDVRGWVTFGPGTTLDNATLRCQFGTGEFSLILPATEVSGTGHVILDGSQDDRATIVPAAGVPVGTFGPDITISTTNYGGTLGSATQSVHVLGRLNVPSGTVYVKGPDWRLAEVSLSGTGTVRILGDFPSSRLNQVRRIGTGGTLAAEGTIDNTGSTLDLDATGNLLVMGTLKGGRVTSTNGATLLTNQYGVLDGVTIDFDWNATQWSHPQIRNGLGIDNGHTVTFNTGPNLFTHFGSITGAGSVVVNYANSSTGYVTADAIGPGITFRTGVNSAASSGYRCTLAVPLLQGTVSVQTGGMTLALAASNWINTGTLAVSQGTLELGGSFTPDSVGNFSRTGGTVRVTGTINGAGQTLTLDESTGTWDFADATMTGGTIRATGAQTINVVRIGAATATTFDGVIIDGPLVLNAGATLRSGTGGVNLVSQAIRMLSNSSPGAATQLIGPVGGTGQVLFASGDSVVKPSVGPYTYGPGISFLTAGGSGTIGATGLDVTIQGTVQAEGPGRSIVMAGSSFTNAGTITATNGGIIGLNPAAFFNQGTLDLTGGVLRLTGSFSTAQARALVANPTALQLAGVMDNASDTFTASASVPLTLLAGSRINGGTLAAEPGAVITSTGTAMFAAGLALAAPVRHGPGTLSLAGGVTGAGGSVTLAATSASAATVSIATGSVATYSGDLTIAFDGATSNNIVSGPAGTLTLDPSTLVRTASQGGTVRSTGALVLRGTVSAQTPGKVITLAGVGVTNAGTIQAVGGSGLLVATTSGSATTFANSGTVAVGSASNMRIVGTLTNTGSFQIEGTALLDYSGVSPAAWVLGQLSAGRSGSTGILNPAAAADPTRAVGYAEASVLLGLSDTQAVTYAGQTTDATTLILRGTIHGDTNLDGLITPDDYARLDRGLTRNLTGWVNGDFDYNNVVDQADYLLMDLAFIRQSGLTAGFLVERELKFGGEYVAALTSSVPEPSALVSAAAIVATVRRRRGIR